MTKTHVLLLVIGLSACSSRVGVKTYDRDIKVAVFREPHLPECGYTEIGEAQWTESPDSDSVNEARKLAHQKGANLIVIHDSYIDRSMTSGLGVFLVGSHHVTRTAQMAKWTNLRCQH